MAVASEHHEGSLQEEVELLEAIYIHELTIEGLKDRPSSISLLLHPSTGDEGEKQYVCLTLEIFLPDEYPNTLPGIYIRNSRGLSDAHVESIISNLRELAESRLGSPMLYELIEYAKESLTDNNIPSCACAICLSHFQDSHSFTKTECYHYFHCSCLARYIDYSLRKINENQSTMNINSSEGDQEEKQIVCPMCRLPITYDLEALKAAPEDVFSDNETSYSPDKKMKQLQQEMAALYDKQFKKGGIINVEEEKNKFLIEIKTASVQQNTEETTLEDDNTRDNDSDTGKPTSGNVVVKQNKSTNYPDKSSEERRRERPSSSRKSQGRGGHQGHYRSEGRWNERNEGPRNERQRGSRTEGRWNERNEGSRNEGQRGSRTEGRWNERNEGPRNERQRGSRTEGRWNERTEGSRNEGQRGSRTEGRWNERSEGPRNERQRGIRTEGRWNERNEGSRNERPRSSRTEGHCSERSEGPRYERPRGTNERGFPKGQRDREVNQKKQGAEKYKGRQRNESNTKCDRAEENEAVLREINGLKSSSNIQQDQSVQDVPVKSDVKSDKPVDKSDAALGLESRNDDKGASKMTVKREDNIQNTKRTDGEYRQKRRDRPRGRKDNKKDFSHRGNDQGDQKDGSRSRNADTSADKTSLPSSETPSTDKEKVNNDDKRTRRQNRPKKTRQNDKDGKISLSNVGQNSPSNIEKTKPLKVESQGELNFNENEKSSQCDSKTEEQSATSVVRPPPGFDRIERKSRGPTGPPPGFESKDLLVGKHPPPGF